MGAHSGPKNGLPMSAEPTVQQGRAIEAPLGPVLVVAGPGAGKTFCLIGRINHLIGRLGIDPRRILAVTFTNKAAEEIASRLHETRGPLAVRHSGDAPRDLPRNPP